MDSRRSTLIIPSRTSSLLGLLLARGIPLALQHGIAFTHQNAGTGLSAYLWAMEKTQQRHNGVQVFNKLAKPPLLHSQERSLANQPLGTWSARWYFFTCSWWMFVWDPQSYHVCSRIGDNLSTKKASSYALQHCYSPAKVDMMVAIQVTLVHLKGNVPHGKMMFTTSKPSTLR